MNPGVMILIGGKSSRMGKDKAALDLHGESFLKHLLGEAKAFDEVLVSVAHNSQKPEGVKLVEDLVKECGPMGGILSGLVACESEALLCVACDMPMMSGSFMRKVADAMTDDMDVLLTVTGDGKWHPLCSIYRKSCLPVFEKHLKEGDYKLKSALSELKVGYFEAGTESFRLKNVNTPEEYRRFNERNYIAICGFKNSGKTTMVEKLIPELRAYGLKIATVKHDGHSFEPDVPGTDSYRFFMAGADTSIVFDGTKYSLTRRHELKENEIADLAPDADLILLEGFKHSGYAKLEMVRGETGKHPIEGISRRLGYITNVPGKDWYEEGLPVFDPEDAAGIAAFIVKLFGEDRLKEEE